MVSSLNQFFLDPNKKYLNNTIVIVIVMNVIVMNVIVRLRMRMRM